ncbi:MAG: HNH endonuclease domain-containing protein [Microscillaceae bacterium]|nr:HNH endonuclease domain-containing protein [Microscillaceae bacterium]
MIKFREHLPKRTCTKVYEKYTNYKSFLRKDFHKRCGYCNAPDFIKRTRDFQIDHFVPKAFWGGVIQKNNYYNLVYSCQFCNRAKSQKWPTCDRTKPHNGMKGFIDPVRQEYDEHLGRTNKGEIIYKTPLGGYIYNELNLYLKRHAILWKLERLEVNLKEVQKLNSVDNDHSEVLEKLEYTLLAAIKNYEFELELEENY